MFPLVERRSQTMKVPSTSIKSPSVKPPSARTLLDRLQRAYGDLGWWPVADRCEDPAMEIALGAILTQNTAWRNVERALDRLHDAGMTSIPKLLAIEEKALAELLRPSGTFRVKAKRVKAFVEAVQRLAGGRLDEFLAGPASECRERLLAIPGIGPETADAILLYAGRHKTFVVDAYARRILHRHFLIGERESYESLRRRLLAIGPWKLGDLRQAHALLVEVGKRHCRVRARCTGCPLEEFPHHEFAGQPRQHKTRPSKKASE